MEVKGAEKGICRNWIRSKAGTRRAGVCPPVESMGWTYVRTSTTTCILVRVKFVTWPANLSVLLCSLFSFSLGSSLCQIISPTLCWLNGWVIWTSVRGWVLSLSEEGLKHEKDERTNKSLWFGLRHPSTTSWSILTTYLYLYLYNIQWPSCVLVLSMPIPPPNKHQAEELKSIRSKPIYSHSTWVN